MFTVEQLAGLEILDSRGRPTVMATCRLEGGAVGSASVPSGASTGAAEAVELRDGDPKRYGGLGCRRAAANVAGPIHECLAGRPFADQSAVDRATIDLDGTPDKSRLGANAILAVSLAFARAAAAQQDVPLYAYFGRLLGLAPSRLPRPTINLFSGGLHAGKQVPIQDVLIVPASARTIDECLAVAHDVYESAADLIGRKYGARRLTADEGGLAPPVESAEAMLEDAVTAIREAGYDPGADVALAIDVASTHFFHEGRYQLGEDALDANGMIQRVTQWLDRYPIVSIEDALAEDDWSHWPALKQAVAGRALVVGDDLLCTNPARIQRAIESEAADALLLKVNQIGTLTEAVEAYRLARSAGWQITISARSGETEDDWCADLAVGWAGDQTKIGSITQSERLAKYNRLLAIESETRLPLVTWPGDG